MKPHTALANLKIGGKLFLMTLAGLGQLILIASLSLLSLHDSNLAAEKAQHYAHKMDIAERMAAQQLDIALLASDLPNPRDRQAVGERIAAIAKEYREEIEYFKEAATTQEDRERVGDIDRAFTAWTAVNERVGLPTLRAALDSYLKYRRMRADQFQQEQRATIARVEEMITGFALFILVSSLLVSKFIARGITGPMDSILKIIGFVSEGDVTREVPGELLVRKDEVGMLAKAVRDMSGNLRRIIGEITGSVGVLASASAELSATSTQMSNGSRTASDRAHCAATGAGQIAANAVSIAPGMEHASSSLADVAEATERMTVTIGEIAGNSEKARRVTEDATRQARQIQEQMDRLGAAAGEIGKVTDAITEISSQTNLLALNASIEAARAGSAGKGFAVVASEIKALAQQASTATDDIRQKIERVQTSTREGVAGSARVTGVVGEIGDFVASIAAAIEEQSMSARSLARNIAAASGSVKEANRHFVESSRASDNIAKEIAAVDEATGQIASGSEQVRTSATELSTVAERLKETVRSFRV